MVRPGVLWGPLRPCWGLDSGLEAMNREQERLYRPCCWSRSSAGCGRTHRTSRLSGQPAAGARQSRERLSSLAPPKPQDRPLPAGSGPSDPARPSTRPLLAGKRRAGHGASPPPRGEPRSRRRGGWSPLPPCRPLRANLPGQLSPQRGEARGAGRGVVGGGVGEGGGTAGRAAYPEAGPAESLHGRGRSLLQAHHAGYQSEGEAGSFPPGRTGGGEDGRGAPRPALPAGSGRRRRYRPAALGPSGREAPAGAASPRRGLLGRLRRPLEGPRPPLRRRGRPRATPGPAVAVPQRPGTPGLVSRGGRGPAAALLRPLKPGRCCRDVASCFPRVTSLWKDQAPRPLLLEGDVGYPHTASEGWAGGRSPRVAARSWGICWVRGPRPSVQTAQANVNILGTLVVAPSERCGV